MKRNRPPRNLLGAATCLLALVAAVACDGDNVTSSVAEDERGWIRFDADPERVIRERLEEVRAEVAELVAAKLPVSAEMAERLEHLEGVVERADAYHQQRALDSTASAACTEPISLHEATSTLSASASNRGQGHGDFDGDLNQNASPRAFHNQWIDLGISPSEDVGPRRYGTAASRRNLCLFNNSVVYAGQFYAPTGGTIHLHGPGTHRATAAGNTLELTSVANASVWIEPRVPPPPCPSASTASTSTAGTNNNCGGGGNDPPPFCETGEYAPTGECCDIFFVDELGREWCIILPEVSTASSASDTTRRYLLNSK